MKATSFGGTTSPGEQTVERARLYMGNVCAILDRLPLDVIEEIVHTLHNARMQKKRVLIFGNGGSATTASHMASDLNKGAICPGLPRFKALALTDSMPVLTAWANDTSYENIFSEQLDNFVEEGDVVIGISGSGNSMNVVTALDMANKRGAITIALTGFDGGKVKNIAHICLCVPADKMEQIEDVHVLLGHLFSTCLR